MAEVSGDKGVWGSYLEQERDRESLRRYLERHLGEYVTAREIHWPPGMRNAALCKWKSSGRVKAERIKGRWYYALEDLLKASKEE